MSELARANVPYGVAEEIYAAGSVIVREGDTGDCLYQLIDGRVRISAEGASGTVDLAELAPGDMFGEIALLTSTGVRQATAIAATPVVVRTLRRESFEYLLQSRPQLASHLATAAERMLRVKFLRQATPFASLAGRELEAFADRLDERALAAGANLVNQGEAGSEAYLLRSGRLEVVLDTGAGERRLATLPPGALVGEAALLSDQPRNATVRALEPSTVMVLSRLDLQQIVSGSVEVAGMLTWLLSNRARPCRAVGVEAHAVPRHDGQAWTVLKDPVRHAYYRLTPEGAFLWQRLDGLHTMRMLTLDYMSAFKLFSPDAVAGVVAGLIAAGFASVPKALTASAVQPGLFWRAAAKTARMLDWQIAVSGVDRAIERAFRSGPHLLFTRPALALMAGISVSGIPVLIAQSASAMAGFGSQDVAFASAGVIAAYLVALVLHEAGHAFAVKACGREIPRLGVGWHWVVPIGFVDTSDMWITGYHARVLVSLAGPYANLATAGLAALMTLASLPHALHAALWLFAALSYALAAVNLNPVLDLDGYHIVADWLDRPNLRRQTLTCIAGLARGVVPWAELAREHKPELIYGITSFIGLGAMSVLAAVCYSTLLQERVATALGAVPAVALFVLVAAAAPLAAVGAALTDFAGSNTRLTA